MKVLIDLCHPADAHFFRYPILELKKRGHTVVVTTKNIPITTNLTEEFGITHKIIDVKTKARILAPARLFLRDFLIYRAARTFKPDLLTGINSVFCAHVSWLLRKPSVIWDDTDHYKLLHRLTRPFATVIQSPDCYYAKPHKKQVFYPGYHELSYLQPKRFQPNADIVKSLGINPDEKYCIIRLSAWQAFHDIGQKGFGKDKLIDFVKTISKYAKPYISAEAPTVPELEKYCLVIPPHLIHHILAYASLYIGEGASMASECATLGIPTVYLNSLKLGYINMLEKYGLVRQAKDIDEAAEMSVDCLQNPDIKVDCMQKRSELLKNKIDMVDYVVKVIERFSKN